MVFIFIKHHLGSFGWDSVTKESLKQPFFVFFHDKKLKIYLEYEYNAFSKKDFALQDRKALKYTL